MPLKPAQASSTSPLEYLYHLWLVKLWSCVHACTPKNRALTSINVHLICLSFAYLSILNWHPSTDSRLVLRMALRHWLSLQHLQAIAHWWMLAWHCFRRVRWRADATLKVKRHKWWNYTLGVSIPNDVFQRWNNIKIDQIYQVRLSTRVALTACSPQNHRRDPTSHSKSCTSRSAHCSAGHRQRLHAEYWAHQVSRCWVSLDHHLWNEDTIENRSRPSNGTNFLWNHWMKTVCNCLQSKLLFQTPVCNPMPNARYARQVWNSNVRNLQVSKFLDGSKHIFACSFSMYSGPHRHTAQFDVICCTVGHYTTGQFRYGQYQRDHIWGTPLAVFNHTGLALARNCPPVSVPEWSDLLYGEYVSQTQSLGENIANASNLNNERPSGKINHVAFACICCQVLSSLIQVAEKTA